MICSLIFFLLHFVASHQFQIQVSGQCLVFNAFSQCLFVNPNVRVQTLLLKLEALIKVIFVTQPCPKTSVINLAYDIMKTSLKMAGNCFYSGNLLFSTTRFNVSAKTIIALVLQYLSYQILNLFLLTLIHSFDTKGYLSFLLPHCFLFLIAE